MKPRDKAQQYFERLNESRYALWVLAVMSFLETIIVPIPIELVLIPFMAANRDRIWRIATVAMAGCIAGAVLGYGVGYVLFESVGQWFIGTFGHEQTYESYRAFFDDYGFLAVVTVGILPIPFQLAMITAGMASYPLTLFLLATVIARGLRYYGLAWLVRRYGDKARSLWEDHAVLTSISAAAIVVAISLTTKYLAGLVV